MVGRPSYDFVRKYFCYNKETNQSKCMIDNCTTILKNRHCGNLERHISSKHPDVSSAITQEKMEMVAKASCSSNDGPTPVKRERSEFVAVRTDSNTLRKAAVHLVTVDGRPLSALQQLSDQPITETDCNDEINPNNSFEFTTTQAYDNKRHANGDPMLAQISELLKEHDSKSDEYEKFGDLVAEKLRKLNRVSSKHAMRLMLDVLYKFEDAEENASQTPEPIVLLSPELSEEDLTS